MFSRQNFYTSKNQALLGRTSIYIISKLYRVEPYTNVNQISLNRASTLVITKLYYIKPLHQCLLRQNFYISNKQILLDLISI